MTSSFGLFCPICVLHEAAPLAPQMIVSFLIFPFSSSNSLDGILIEEVFQGFLFTGIVVVQQQGVELLHVLVGNRQDTGTGSHKDLVCKGHAGALIAFPEELAPCAPGKGLQGLFCGGGICRP